MSARTILTLANGNGIDLLAPQAADIDFAAIAEQLAKEPRYNGATPDEVYSVAEHCVRGCSHILHETGDRLLAAYFLLHDGHEAMLRDDTTPKKRAIAELASEQFGVLSEQIMAAFDMLTDRHDVAIHAAAGLPWPMHPAMKVQVKAYDVRMFVTEWRDLMRGVPHPDWTPYADHPAFPAPIEPWTWQRAKSRWLTLAWHLLPGLNGEALPTSDPINGGVIS